MLIEEKMVILLEIDKLIDWTELDGIAEEESEESSREVEVEVAAG